MFFFVSKLFWFLAEPTNFFSLLFVCAAAGLFTRWSRAARRVLTAAALLFALCGLGPVGALLMRPLEDRFVRPGDDMPPPDGIIVLGGAMDEAIDLSRGVLALGVFGSRMTEGAALARRFPLARVIFTGGSPSLGGKGPSEADLAKRLSLTLGVDESRITLEERSRNTYENAIFTRDIVEPKPEQRFLLVTSGFHTPRSMGVFRRAGFNVAAWPADYTTRGRASDFTRVNMHAGDGLLRVDTALKEWVGLVAYRAAGMTDALFPAP